MQGIILAGGRSSRFGDDKALALVDGVPMIERAVRLLKSLDLRVCVIGNKQRDYSSFDCRIENDLIPGKGPLGGLYTAFSIFEGETLLVLTCDMPLVTRELIASLIQPHNPPDEITLYQKGDEIPAPFPGVYGPDLKAVARDCLESDQFSMRQFIRRTERKKLLQFTSDSSILANINFKKDLQSLHQKAKGSR